MSRVATFGVAVTWDLFGAYGNDVFLLCVYGGHVCGYLLDLGGKWVLNLFVLWANPVVT